MRQFMRKHDTIFWYAKGSTWTFNADDVRVQHSEKTKDNYKSGLVGSGFVGADHMIHKLGKVPEDYWNFAIAPRGKEYLGYPTQKPIKLLERIVAAASHRGEIVLDPFCGCGTAVDAAQKLGRNWIGIDITTLAVDLIEKRMKDRYGADLVYDVVGLPADTASALRLASDEPHQFQYWIVGRIGGQQYKGGRKGADRGIDGFIYFTRNDAAHGKSTTEAAIISVKAGQRVGVAMVRDLKGVLDREKAPIGIFVCVINPTRKMEREAASAGVYQDPTTGLTYPRLQLYTLAEYFTGLRPKVPLLDARASYKSAKRALNEEQDDLDL